MTSSRAEILSAITEGLSRALEAPSYDAAKAELQGGLQQIAKLAGSDRHTMEVCVWMQYAIVAERWNDLQKAVEYNEKLVRERPGNPSTHLALSALYRRLGNTQMAGNHLRKCAELAEESGDRISLAILAGQGHLPVEASARARMIEYAIATYEDVLREWTHDAKPELYAAAQARLGDLRRLEAERLSGSLRVEMVASAATAYGEALRVYTEEAHPEKHRAISLRLRELEELK